MSLFRVAVVLTCLLCFFSLKVYSQLDSLHYLPPLKQVSNNAAIKEQAIYLSTPSVVGFTVNVYRGASVVPYYVVTNLSKGSPKRIDAFSSPALANGDNNITLVNNNNTGVKLSNSGLRFESANGERFYVNYRGRSNAQAGSLTCKGTKALGLEFRWGGVPNRANNNNLSTSLGIMAVEDGTVVTVSDYDVNCLFRLQGDVDGITSDMITINLDAGESYVLEANQRAGTGAVYVPNVDGWLGAKIVSTKPIAIANGGLNFGVNPSSQARDTGIDQPVPVSIVGREYVFIRGNGANETEFPVIVATADGTEVKAGGVSLGVINAGQYLEISGSNYSSASAGANMYVQTSKAAYAFQCLAGQSGRQTVGMNFIAPVNCLLPDSMDEVSEINRIAGVNSNASALTIVSATTTPDANIVVREDGNLVALPSGQAVAGTSDWKTFFVGGLSGEVSVSSTGPVAVGTFMALGRNAGLAGYFSGFDTVPVVDVQITGGGCFPSGDLEETTGVFDAYQWYRNGQLILGATSSVYTPLQLGDYYVEVTDNLCSYSSPVVSVYNCDPDIVLRKTVDKSVATDGDVITYTIQVESLGVNPVTNLVVNDVFPSELDLVGATPSFGGWLSPNWTIGTMNPGQIHTLTIEARVPSKPVSGVVVNSVSNSQDQVDSNDSPDVLSANVTLVPKIADLSLVKTINNATPRKGDMVIFTISLTNHGVESATGVKVTDVLPSNMVYVPSSSVVPVNTVYDVLTGVWDLSSITIANGETVSLQIAVILNEAEVVKVNMAEISVTGQTDSDSNPNNGN